MYVSGSPTGHRPDSSACPPARGLKAGVVPVAAAWCASLHWGSLADRTRSSRTHFISVTLAYRLVVRECLTDPLGSYDVAAQHDLHSASCIRWTSQTSTKRNS